MSLTDQVFTLLAQGYKLHELVRVVGPFESEKDLDKEVIKISRVEGIVVRSIWEEYGPENYHKSLKQDIIKRAQKEGNPGGKDGLSNQ